MPQSMTSSLTSTLQVQQLQLPTTKTAKTATAAGQPTQAASAHAAAIGTPLALDPTAKVSPDFRLGLPNPIQSSAPVRDKASTMALVCPCRGQISPVNSAPVSHGGVNEER